MAVKKLQNAYYITATWIARWVFIATRWVLT